MLPLERAAAAAALAASVALLFAARRQRSPPRLDPAAVRALAGFDVLFIRHGNTAPNAVDIERALTEKGRQQSIAASRTYMRKLRSPVASFALSSPALRCQATARLVLGDRTSHIETVAPIYDSLLQPEATAIFRKLSYAPLSTYIADGPAAAAVLGAYAIAALNAIGRATAALDAPAAAGRGGATAPTTPRRTLCVFGHAVYSASIAHLLAQQRSLPAASMQALLSDNMQEACGLLVGADAAAVVLHDATAPSTAATAGAAAGAASGAASDVASTFIDKLALIVVRDRRQLVARSRGKAAFFTPGGKRERGESDHEALIRECREELAVDLRRHTIQPYGVFQAQAHGKPEGIMVRMTCYTGARVWGVCDGRVRWACDGFVTGLRRACAGAWGGSVLQCVPEHVLGCVIGSPAPRARRPLLALC